MNPSLHGRWGERIILGVTVLAAIAWVAPLLWVLALSFKPNALLAQRTDILFAPPYTLKNYGDILATSLVFRWIMNSCVVAFGQTLLVLLLSATAGYGFARTEFRGKTWIYRFVLAGLAVPQSALVIPLHRLFADWSLHNTYAGLIMPGLAAPFGVFLMTQYFKAIPRDLEEAALLDNASRWTIFTRIILPLSLPALATLGIVTFLGAWNDYLWPLISATQSEHYTLTLGLASTQTNFAQSEGLGFLMAQAVFASAPVLVLYCFFQKYIVAAVAGTRVG
jgi:multiple sugar transport system permease protein